MLSLLYFQHTHQISPRQLKDIVSQKSKNCEVLYEFESSNLKMWSLESSVQIIWHLTPLKNPHNCKVLEVIVKATRRSLKSLCCYSHFNLDKPLNFVAAKALLLSGRPLTRIKVLTVNNFLIDDLDGAVSTGQIDNPVRQWQIVKSVMKMLWIMYLEEYIVELRQAWQ
jgi:hypothetical protein